MAADAIQLAAMPLFGEGVLSPLNDAVDLVTSVALVWLVGWHLAFLPALALELVPVADLAPTWTLAVGIVWLDRRRRAANPPAPGPASGTRTEPSHAEILPDTPARPEPRDP